MHYGKDEDLVLLDTVDDAIGETVYKTAPETFFNDRPRTWVGDNILDRGENLN